jgi:hypothetical protein
MTPEKHEKVKLAFDSWLEASTDILLHLMTSIFKDGNEERDLFVSLWFPYLKV